MARIKRSKTYQGLHTIPVYKNDTDNTIFNIIEVPEVFPRGKSYFLILGSDEFVQGSDLLIEVLDKNGEVVYSEIPNYVESSARAISVWVFSGTARGEATVTILGKLRDVPREWQDKYNVKATIPIVINPSLINNQPIRFENAPFISASVADRAYLFVTESITSLQTYTSLFYQARGEYNSVNNTYKVSLWQIAEDELIVPPSFPNGEFRANNLTVAGIDFTSSYSASYKSELGFLRSDGVNFYVNPPPFVYDRLETKDVKYWVIYDDSTDGKTQGPPKYIYNFDSTYSWSLQYQVTDTGSITPLTASFAKIDFSNLQTFSGKINSINVYKKNIISDASYVLMGEFPAEPSELFISRSNSIDYFVGQFNSDTWVRLNWHSSSINGGTLIESAHVTQSDLNIYNSILMSQSEAQSEIFKVYPKNTKIQFYGDAEYTLTAQILGQPLLIGETAEMNIYVSGSAFNHDILDDQLGKLVANIITEEFTNYNERVFNFIADYSNTGTIVFEIVSGRWNVANISIQAASDDGFNPDSLQIYIPLDNIKRNEIANFKIEFLNSKKESSPTKIETITPILLKNNPVYIEMDDNVVSGSLSIGSSAKTGLIMAGNDSPTFKSVGYEGFNLALVSGAGGFAFYSGSPEELSQSYNTGNYAGVGFELNAGRGTGSLAFRYSEPTGSYLIITASIYALPGSNVTLATGSGGGSGTSSAGLWTESVDGTYISRLSSVQISGSLDLRDSFRLDNSGESFYVLTDTLYLSASSDIQIGKIDGSWIRLLPSSINISASTVYIRNSLLDIEGPTHIGSLPTNIHQITGSLEVLGSFTASEGISAASEINTFGGLYVLKNTYLGDTQDDRTEITGSIHWQHATGSLYGTSSWAESSSQAISASYALSASYAPSAGGAGLWTASLDGTYISRESNVQITGSLDVSAGITASLYGTASWAESSSWAQFAATSSISVTSASYALSSSYALSASYAPGGSSPGGSGIGDKIFLWQNFR